MIKILDRYLNFGQVWLHLSNKSMRRPLVITQCGKGVAVVLDVEEYEAMQEKIERLEEMLAAEAQLASEMGISNDVARASVLDRIKK